MLIHNAVCCGRRLTLVFTCGQVGKHVFSLLSNNWWETYNHSLATYAFDSSSLNFGNLSQVTEYEPVFPRLPPAMETGACRRACKPYGVCADLSKGHGASVACSSEVGNWSDQTVSFMSEWCWRAKFAWMPPSTCQGWQWPV